MKSTSLPFFYTLILAFCFPLLIFAQTEVPRGGAVIDAGPGLNLVNLKIKNTTGEPATDVTITVWKADGETSNIVSADIEQTDKDKIDDNYDGDLDDDETDTTNNPAKGHCRIIIDGGNVKKKGEIEINVTLDEPTTPGTKITVRFSKEKDGKHYDMLAMVPMDGMGSTALINVPLGTQQGNTSIINNSPDYLSMVLLQNGEVPLSQASLEPPYENSEIFGSSLFENFIFFNPPLPPFEQVNLNFELANPVNYNGASLAFIAMEGFPFDCGMELAELSVSPCSPLNLYHLFAGAFFNADLQHCKEYTFTNNLNQSVSDLHAIFSGTGGDLTTTIISNPPGCPAPAIPSNGQVINRMDVDWGTACVDPGESVRVKVCTRNGPLNFEGGFWTLNGVDVGTLTADDVAEGQESGLPSNGMDLYKGDELLATLPLDGSGVVNFSITNLTGNGEENVDLHLVMNNELGCILPIENAYNEPSCQNEVNNIDCELLEMELGAVPLGMYPQRPLEPGDTWALESFSNPINGLKVIPPQVLDPTNPFICGEHYYAFSDLPEFPMEAVGLTFERPGPYFVQVTYANGIVEENIFHVGTSFSPENNNAACYTGPFREVPCGNPDVAIVSSTLGFGHSWGDKGVIVPTIDSAAAAICKAFEEKGEKITVVIDAHGVSGEIDLGTEILKMDNLEAFLEKVKDKISNLIIFTCSLAEGEAGRAFLCAFEQGLNGNVTGYTGSSTDNPGPPAIWYTSGEPYSWEETTTSTFSETFQSTTNYSKYLPKPQLRNISFATRNNG